jgi:tRNA threonylcarbamoyladenosine biosynthesis protein TsaE
MLTFLVNDEQDTVRLAAALADVLPPGTVVGLIGNLGAGKTRFVQAISAALGVPAGNVTSPTFVLLNEYQGGRMPVYHFDTYRLKDEDEFLALGPEEYFESNGLTLVEWCDRVAGVLPEDRVEISIEITGETERRITIDAASSQLKDLIGRAIAARGLA